MLSEFDQEKHLFLRYKISNVKHNVVVLFPR